VKQREGDTLRWRGIEWKLSGGRILKNGQSTPDVELTGNVRRMSIEPLKNDHRGMLTQVNAEGQAYTYSGRRDWDWVQKVTVSGEGTVVGVSG
jgi:hypothetical protein